MRQLGHGAPRLWAATSAAKTVSALADQSDGAVGMATRPAPVDFTQPTIESRQEIAVSLPTGQQPHIVSDGWQSVHTGTALTGALIGEIPDDAG